MKRIYLDNAATTPIDPVVVDEMFIWLRDFHGNPSSIHAEGRKVRAGIEEARKTVAHHLNASIGEIFFTSCGTESNNMALKCSVRDLDVARIISSPIEHHCILHPLDVLQKENVEVEMLNIDTQGHVDLVQLENLLKSSDKKTLVSLMHCNNEIGTLLPLKKVAQLCHQYDALFHSDTVQTIGHFPIDVQEIPMAFISGSAHKFHGPKGIGFIYINNNHRIYPYIDGGGQERNMRAGTENVYGIRGLAKALDMACNALDERRSYILGLRAELITRLQEEFQGIEFLGDLNQGHHKVLSVSFPPHPKNDLLLLNLDMEGISASGGSACTSGAEVDSHVLNAIKVSPERKVIRFSFSHFNTLDEIETLINKLVKILEPVNA